LKRYSKEFSILWGLVTDYYSVDRDAKFVNRELLLATLADKIRAEKHFIRFTEIVDLAIAEQIDLSEANVSRVVLLAKKEELGVELASAIAQGHDHSDLVDSYKEICSLTSLEQLTSKGIEVFDATNFHTLFEQVTDDRTCLRVYPRSLGDRLEGGLRPGDKLTAFGRPETGKTALVLTISCGFVREGHRGTYFTNEDRPGALLLRAISCLTGLTKAAILADPQGSYEKAVEAGLERLTVVSLSPGTPKQLEAKINETEPEFIVVDQLRNMEMKAESRVNQLEAAACFNRDMCKKYSIAGIDVTQAGDSASGKAVLEMNDCDFSNTGIPAACDVLLGVGATSEMLDNDTRILSLCKNKTSGDHSHWATKINRFISRYTSI
jgi:archaellum biogenesis ATPase FlaH